MVLEYNRLLSLYPIMLPLVAARVLVVVVQVARVLVVVVEVIVIGAVGRGARVGEGAPQIAVL